MYTVQKIIADTKVTGSQTLFRSGFLKECVRYMYSRKDKNQLVIIDRTGSVVDVGDYVDYTS